VADLKNLDVEQRLFGGHEVDTISLHIALVRGLKDDGVPTKPHEGVNPKAVPQVVIEPDHIRLVGPVGPRHPTEVAVRLLQQLLLLSLLRLLLDRGGKGHLNTPCEVFYGTRSTFV
jgi:hypothetical protein